MEKLILAIKRKLIVQFRYKPQKTKMKTKTPVLDGSEQSMIPIIKVNADKLPPKDRKSKIIPLEEFSAGTGISDLTIFTVDDKLLEERRLNNKAPATSKQQIEILLCILGSKCVTIDEIVEQTTLKSKKAILSTLEQLLKANLVSKHNSFYSASYDIADSSTNNIIAIEAKVRDWKSGIRQAMRYKEYADYSYLAIYEKNIGSCLNNIAIFEQLGIGLIGVSDEGIRVHLKASLSNVRSLENRMLAFERLISVVDERYETFVARNGFVTNNAC